MASGLRAAPRKRHRHQESNSPEPRVWVEGSSESAHRGAHWGGGKGRLRRAPGFPRKAPYHGGDLGIEGPRPGGRCRVWELRPAEERGSREGGEGTRGRDSGGRCASQARLLSPSGRRAGALGGVGGWARAPPGPSCRQCRAARAAVSCRCGASSPYRGFPHLRLKVTAGCRGEETVRKYLTGRINKTEERLGFGTNVHAAQCSTAEVQGSFLASHSFESVKL